jgi:hypothetical protein
MLSYKGKRCHFRQCIFSKRIAPERPRTLKNGLRSSELQEGTAPRLGAPRTRPNCVRGVGRLPGPRHPIGLSVSRAKHRELIGLTDKVRILSDSVLALPP